MELFKAPSPEMVAYTAGLFDGEGSVYYLQSGNRFQASTAQGETNGGEALCRWLQAMWNIGTVNKQCKQWMGEPYDMWSWSVAARREFLFFLETMLPYLVVKRDAAVEGIFWARSQGDARAHWVDAEDRYLRQHWTAEHSQAEIGRALGRSAGAVRHRAKILGLSDKRTSLRQDCWTEDQLGYLRANWESESITAIAAATGRTYRAVRGKARRLNLPDKRKMR